MTDKDRQGQQGLLPLAAVLMMACTACESAQAPPLPVAAIALEPESSAVMELDSVAIAAVLTDSSGAPAQAMVTWRSLDTSVATVTQGGLVRARRAGAVMITGAANGLTATARVTVEAGFVVLESGMDFGRTCGLSITGLAHCWNDVSSAPVDTAHLAALAAGPFFACGLGVAGATTCYGRNTLGQLGTANTSDSVVPVPGVPAFDAIVAGEFSACGITVAGQAWCWGHFEELPWCAGGSCPPYPLPGARVLRGISMGGTHGCAVDDAGAAFCWGYRYNGRLGDGLTGGESDTLTPVAGGLVFQSVSAGAMHTCGRTTDNGVWCWGHNQMGELGDTAVTCPNGQACSAVPHRVPGTLTWRQVSAGSQYSCGVTTTGAVYCWGANYGYQLARDFAVVPQSHVPLAIALPGTFVSVSAGWLSCALAESGAVWCWGRELGPGPRRMPWSRSATTPL